MSTTLIEMETRLRRVERQNRLLIFLLLGFAGMASIAATNRASHLTADEVTTRQLTIIDNHGKVMTETFGLDGVIHVRKFVGGVETNE
jgi:hypothetical protein